MQSGNKRSLSEAQSTDDRRETEQSVLVKPMKETKRQVLKVVMYLRSGFRHSFGIGVSNKHGHFLDYHLSRAVLGYADWVAYPKGDHFLDSGDSHARVTTVSEDGYRLLMGCNDGSIMVWNLVDQNKVGQWTAHSGSIPFLVHRCGILVSVSNYNSAPIGAPMPTVNGKMIKLWNSHTYQLIRTFGEMNGLVFCLDINAKANLVISGQQDSTVRVWSVKNGRCLRTFSDHLSAVRSVLFSKEGIISGCGRNTKYLWHVSSDSSPQPITEPNIFDELSQILLNCDESMIALEHKNKVLVYSWPELKPIREIIVSSLVSCCFHSLRPDLLALAEGGGWSWQGGLEVHNVMNGASLKFQKTSDPLRRHHRLHFTPDGQRLVCLNRTSHVLISDMTEVLSDL